MARVFEIEIDEQYRIIVACQDTDWGWHYFPQKRWDEKWWWIRYRYGDTVCFRSREECDRYITVDRFRKGARMRVVYAILHEVDTSQDFLLEEELAVVENAWNEIEVRVEALLHEYSNALIKVREVRESEVMKWQ